MSKDLSAAVTYIASAEGRLIRSAEIVEALPFLGHGREVAEAMQYLVGRRAIVQLGIEGGARSIVTPNEILLVRNGIDFRQRPGFYRSGCYGEGWGGPITYRVSGADRDMLDGLNAGVMEVVERRRTDYLVYRAGIYPLFFGAFLALSALAWATLRAARFVQRG